MDKPLILLSTLKRRTLPAMTAFTAVIAAALAYLALSPRLYETEARIMVNDRQTSVSELGRDLAKLPDEGAANGASNALATQAELIKSQQVLERAIAKLSRDSRVQNEALPTANKLSQKLRVKIIPATTILELSYRDKDPEMAADLLNAVVNSTREQNVENIRVEARSVREFLEAAVPRQVKLLEQAEAAENRYRQEAGLISVEDQTKELVQSLGTVENQERDLTAQLQDATTQTRSLQQLVGEGSRQKAYISVRIGQDEELKALRTKLDNLETQVIELRSRLGDQHPDLLAAIEQRNEVRRLYENKLSQILSTGQRASGNVAGDALSQELITKLITSDIERGALEQKLMMIRAAHANLQSRLTELPIKQQQLTTLTRTRETAETTLKQLQSKLQEARIAEAQLVSNIQIVSVAETPTEPQWPKKSSVLVVAGALGLLLAVGVVLILELLDNALHEVAEAEALFGQSCLGTLPLLPSRTIDLRQSEPFLDDVYLVEPYRRLLKTLEFRSSKRLRLLAISSALSNEGKSTVVSHLAAVSAMLYQKTLVIDADLYRPNQHRLFNLPLEPGLADVIDGRMTLNQAVQSTSSKNLFVLTSGKGPQRPSILLESAALQSFLEEASETFDLIILDTPPVNNCADALILSRYSDGLVFVVRPGVTTRNGLSQAIGELNKNGVSLMGFVANGVDSQIDKDYFDSNHQQTPSSRFLQRLPLPSALQRWSAIHLGTQL